MKKQEIKDLIISSLNQDISTDSFDKMEGAGISYSFKPGFRDKVLDRLFTTGVIINGEREFLRSWNIAFYRIALTGVAAIVILMISIYLSEGSFTLNSILGLNNGSEDAIATLLTGI